MFSFGQCIGVLNLGGEVGCMISEGPWIFVGLPNIVKVRVEESSFSNITVHNAK